MSGLAEIIKTEITAHGAIPFARFMELALYHPQLGYYETGRNRVGFKGDFYTSVSTGELFGQLLAFRFATWLAALPVEGDRWIIEAGAHDGKLAGDILGWLRQHRTELYSNVRYGIIEPSAERQRWQREKLREFGERVQWFEHVTSTGLGTARPHLNGIIFSNELLDAMPVHRLGWDAARREWFEWGVTVKDDRFVWTRLPSSVISAEAAFNWPEELLEVLPDGYTIETCPTAAQWWREAAGVLRQGRLLTLDYGFTTEEMISPARTKGTLRAYVQHQLSDDLLANPGEQDLTAHVNFSVIQTTGERAGMKTDGYRTQPQFLTGILAEAIKDPAFVDWSTSRTRQFQTLTHPQHLGRAFKVLVQRRESRPSHMATEDEELQARLRLKHAREAAGKLPEELTKFTGNSTAAYHDLEDHNGELHSCIELGELVALCACLGIKARDLFDNGTTTGPKISARYLIARTLAYLEETKLSIPEFEERIGFKVESSLIDPQQVLTWNVDFLRWLCRELGLDWRLALP